MYTFGPLIAKNSRSGRLLSGAPITVTTLDGVTLTTTPTPLVTNHEGYLPAFTVDTDQRVILARPRGGDPLPLYAHEAIQDAAEAADIINTGRLSEASLSSTIEAEAVAPAQAAAAAYLASDPGVADAAAQAAGPAVDQAIANAGGVAGLAPVDAPLAPKRRITPPLIDARRLLLPSDLTGTLPAGVTRDTTRPGPFSDHSLKFTRADGDAPPTLALDVFDTPVDMAGGYLTVWVYLPQLSPHGARIQLGSRADRFHRYQWDLYGVSDTSPSAPHLDGWTAIDLYVEDALPINEPTTDGVALAIQTSAGSPQEFWLGGIVYRPNAPAYPNGVCTMYFDDGYDSHYHHGVPILARHGAFGTTAAIAAAAGTSGFATIAQLREMQDRAGWEIAAHSYSPNGAQYRFDQFTPAELEAEFRNLKTWLVSHGFDTSTWVSPGGVSNRNIWQVGRRYFALHRGVAALGATGIRQGSRQFGIRPSHPAGQFAPNFHTTTATKADLLAVLDGIKESKAWGSMAFHQITTAGPSSEAIISAADLEEIVAHAANIGVPVETPNMILDKANRLG